MSPLSALYFAICRAGQERSISTINLEMSSTLITAHHRFPSRSPTSSGIHQKPYFSPGGRTHTIPPGSDRLHISLSGPALVAAEQCLSSVSVPVNQQSSKASDGGTPHTPNLGSIVFHLNHGILSPRSSDDDIHALQPANPLTVATNIQTSCPDYSWETGHGWSNPSDNSCDISEVVTIPNVVGGSNGDPDSSACENGPQGSDLAPLASETFKQELYIRGYLKRPTSRPSNIALRKSRISLMFGNRSIFAKVLARCQGRKVAECLKAEQEAAETPSGPDAHLSERQLSPSVGCVTLLTPHADGLESPWVDTNMSASESFDLHEFSYITAFTTPPSSPSIVLDAKTLKKGVGLDDSKHAA